MRSETARPNTESAENRLSFQRRLVPFTKEGRLEIMFAYDIAKAAHRTQQRDQGERYFEHPRNVALILLDELHITNPHLIAAAFLHDTAEDSAVFGNPYDQIEELVDGIIIKRQIEYSEWSREAFRRICRSYSPETAEMVMAVTKPKPDGSELPTNEAAERKSLELLTKATPEAKLLKMADRLHNLRTLLSTTPDKQRRKIQETEQIYFPIFELAREVYPEETEYLLTEMKKAIAIIREQQTS